MGNKDRERKKRERLLRDARQRQRRLHQLRALLDGLGFVDCDAALCELLGEQRYPEPTVSLTPHAQRRAAASQVGEAVRHALAATPVSLGDDVQVRLPSFFADFLSVADMCRAEAASDGGGIPAWSRFASRVAANYDRHVRQGVAALVRCVDEALLPFCDLTDGIYFARYDNVPAVRGPRMNVVIDVHGAQPISFTREGKSRPGWRCGMPFQAKGIEWVTWGDEEGFPSPTEVYVQGHVLERMYERLRFDSPSGTLDWLWQSLRKPTLVKHKGALLAAFRVAQWRLGYFPVELIDGKVLLTTFLFLTNAGTPEGDRLREHTGFRTDQIQYLQMDALPYFVLSDVQNDAALRSVFADCGCEHLFDIFGPGHRRFVLSMARETRRHLGMDLLPTVP